MTALQLPIARCERCKTEKVEYEKHIRGIQVLVSHRFHADLELPDVLCEPRIIRIYIFSLLALSF